jgi:hypothetical protein
MTTPGTPKKAADKTPAAKKRPAAQSSDTYVHNVRRSTNGRGKSYSDEALRALANEVMNYADALLDATDDVASRYKSSAAPSDDHVRIAAENLKMAPANTRQRDAFFAFGGLLGGAGLSAHISMYLAGDTAYTPAHVAAASFLVMIGFLLLGLALRTR